jgi:hypothetical protein
MNVFKNSTTIDDRRRPQSGADIPVRAGLRGQTGMSAPHLGATPCLHTLSPHFVSMLCRLRFVSTLCPYALSKAKNGSGRRWLRLYGGSCITPRGMGVPPCEAHGQDARATCLHTSGFCKICGGTGARASSMESKESMDSNDSIRFEKPSSAHSIIIMHLPVLACVSGSGLGLYTVNTHVNHTERF